MAGTKSVLIAGASGFVGTQLALRLRDSYKVYGTYRRNRIQIPGVMLFPLALENRDWVKKIVYLTAPDFIIFAAAQDPINPFSVFSKNDEDLHTNSPSAITGFSDIFQSKLIYLSNSYVFDGHKGNYHEDDIVLPARLIGKAKLAGENYLRAKAMNSLILRVGPLIGRGVVTRPSLLDHIRISLTQGKRIALPAEEIQSFTFIDYFLNTMERVLASGLKNRTLHCHGLEKMTYFEMGKKIARRLKLDESLITPAPRAETRDYSLNSTETIKSLEIKPFFFEEGLDLIEQRLMGISGN